MAVIELEKVRREFPDGTVAVRDIDLRIDDGEFVILVGPSGCGKSTLLRMIIGLEDVTAGTVRIDGQDMTDRQPRDRNLAMVFQDYALYPHLTVRENLEFPLKLAKRDRAEIARAVDEAVGMLEIEELLDRKPAQLSGGQRQRVAMGRAMVRRPNAFLLDEPLSNLDAKLRVQMRLEISRLQDRLGVTTVYVTHDQTEAMTLGDRVAVMRKGTIQQVGTPRDLYLRPANLFVAGFVGSPAMNFFPASVRSGRVELPMLSFDLPPELRALGERLESREVIAGIRPEHFAWIGAPGARDADVGADGADEAVRFRARIDVLEWLGSELYAHFPVSRGDGLARQRSNLHDVADELAEAGVRTPEEQLTVARIDPASEVTEGEEADIWLDTGRVHYFDADTGENLALTQTEPTTAEAVR